MFYLYTWRPWWLVGRVIGHNIWKLIYLTTTKYNNKQQWTYNTYKYRSTCHFPVCFLLTCVSYCHHLASVVRVNFFKNLLHITFKGNPLRMIQAKFGLNWPSGFRGEGFWKSLQTDDGCIFDNNFLFFVTVTATMVEDPIPHQTWPPSLLWIEN
jgi:hypothetical protein